EGKELGCVLRGAGGFALGEKSGSIPSFIGTLPAAVRHFLREFAGDLRPGDVLITNDPWQGTGHMSDVCLAKPIFHGGRLVAFSATTSHMPAIGGACPPPRAARASRGSNHPPLGPPTP